MCEYGTGASPTCVHTPGARGGCCISSGELLPERKDKHLSFQSHVKEHSSVSMYWCKWRFAFISIGNLLLSRNVLWGVTVEMLPWSHTFAACTDAWMLSPPPFHLQSKHKVCLFLRARRSLFKPPYRWIPAPCTFSSHGPLRHTSFMAVRGDQCMCWCGHYGNHGLMKPPSLVMLRASYQTKRSPSLTDGTGEAPASPLIPRVTLICLCNRLRLGHENDTAQHITTDYSSAH